MNKSSEYCTFYIVRHGQAQANVDKIVAGSTDTPLTKEGESQAQLRSLDFGHVKFDAVFSSDLMRANKTAEIISMDKKLAVNTKKLLRERHFGDWEGRKEAEIKAENEYLFEKLKNLPEVDKRNFKFNAGYESNDEIVSRMLTFLREAAVQYPGKDVLVVSHGSMMRSVLIHLGFGSYDELPLGCIENTGYFILESDGVDFFVKGTYGISKSPK
jgi:broad specificity phosphatase PhoE